MSLPLRECGLKFFKVLIYCILDFRHSPCGSVDWNCSNRISSTIIVVTPLAGVWIEILFRYHHNKFLCVTPLAGVWIEINKSCTIRTCLTVTPLAGVWIEIVSDALRGFRHMSLPLRECGLKYIRAYNWFYPRSSLPLRECGLKLHNILLVVFIDRHSPCGSVDWNHIQSMRTVEIS